LRKWSHDIDAAAVPYLGLRRWLGLPVSRWIHGEYSSHGGCLNSVSLPIGELARVRHSDLRLQCHRNLRDVQNVVNYPAKAALALTPCGQGQGMTACPACGVDACTLSADGGLSSLAGDDFPTLQTKRARDAKNVTARPPPPFSGCARTASVSSACRGTPGRRSKVRSSGACRETKG